MKYLIIIFALINSINCHGQIYEGGDLRVFTSIDEAIKESDSVYFLQLKNNNYSKSLPFEIVKFKNLKKLSFTGNDCDTKNIKCSNIDSVSSVICSLKDLKELLLVNNGLKKIPDCLDRIDIKILDLSDNPEINLNNIFYITSLERLSLNGCALTNISNEIKNLRNLKWLGLENNNLTKDKIKTIQNLLPNCKIIWESEAQ